MALDIALGSVEPFFLTAIKNNPNGAPGLCVYDFQDSDDFNRNRNARAIIGRPRSRRPAIEVGAHNHDLRFQRGMAARNLGDDIVAMFGLGAGLSIDLKLHLHIDALVDQTRHTTKVFRCGEEDRIARAVSGRPGRPTGHGACIDSKVASSAAVVAVTTFQHDRQDVLAP